MLRIQGGRKKASTLLRILALAAAAALVASCVLNPKSDPKPIPDPVDTDRNRKTTDNLVTKWLPHVYSTMDSIKYEETLDEAYIFELLPEEVDDDDPRGWWDKTEELAIAGNMFGARFNETGQKVSRITLDLVAKNTVVDNTNYPGKPPGEVWKKVTSAVDLKVVVDDPTDPEGIINFIVISDQIFVCRPDPDVDTLWVIYKQIDQPSIN
ncbi:MAG: hypothetical protein ABIH26_06115 [Candidatus Eisenbacteria bacterium]